MCILIFILCYIISLHVDSSRLAYILCYVELELVLLVSVSAMFFLFMCMVFIVLAYLITSFYVSDSISLVGYQWY